MPRARSPRERTQAATTDDVERAVEARPPNGPVRRYGLIRPLLPVALAAALLGGLFLRVDVSAIAGEIGRADPRWLPVILAANYASDWFRSVRWEHLLSPLRRPGVLLLFAASQLGSAVNLLVPLRAGEAVRVRIVSQRSGVSASSLVGTLFGEVMSDLVVFSIYIVVGLLLLEEAAFLWPVALVSAVMVGGGMAGAYYLAGRAERWPEPAAAPGARAWLGRELYHFARGLQSFRDPAVIFHVTWSAQAIWLCEAAMFYACGRALDLDLSPGAYLLLLVVANIAGAIPLTQAGFGLFEVTLTGLIVALGPDEAQAAAYAIFVHVLLTFPHVVSGPLAALALRINPADVLFLGGKREGV